MAPSKEKVCLGFMSYLLYTTGTYKKKVYDITDDVQLHVSML